MMVPVVVVATNEGTDYSLDVTRDEEGFIDANLLALVDEAIKEYPNMAAPQWLGGVAAIRVVERWIAEHGKVLADKARKVE